MAGSKMLARQIEALKGIEGKKVEAGWFESDRYTSGENGKAGLAVATVARIQNYGATFTRNFGKGPVKIVIPARPFMTEAYIAFLKQRKNIEYKMSRKLLAGTMTPEQTLGAIGLYLEGFIVKSIKNGAWERNSKFTIAIKGFDVPLVHTGHMSQTVNSKVV